MTPCLRQARQRLTRARADYLRDMEWLRRRHGIVAEAEPYLVKAALLACLDALEKGDAGSFDRAIAQFDSLHQSAMAQVAWGMLEQTKRELKRLDESHPRLFKQKLRLWNRASWAFTTARCRRETARYRDCIRTVTSI